MRVSTATSAEIRFSLVYSGLFLALGAHLAFGQLWYEDWGLDPAEIGWLSAFAIAVRIVAGVALPALSDWIGKPRRFLAVLSLIGAMAGVAHLGVETRTGLYLLTAVLACAFAGMIPLTDAHGYAAADRMKFSYRRARSVGSFAFLAATFCVGAIAERFGNDVVMIWIGASLALGAWAALAAPMHGQKTPGPVWRGLGEVLARPGIPMFLLCVAFLNASHAVYYAYGSIHWRAIGYSETLIGGLWAWGVLAEIALFLVGRSVIEHLGPTRGLALAGLAGAVRWGAMTFDPGIAALFALQTLHAATFGLMHLSALEFIARTVPEARRATAQGLMSAMAGGLAMVAATVLAAWAYPLYDAAAYLIGAFAGLGGAVAAVVLARALRVQPHKT
ncbi:MAG: MFS transporter [Pseudomonadota bacterium]